MKRTYLKKISEKGKQKASRDALKTRELHAFFKETWDSREDYEGVCFCFESGRALEGYIYRSNTACYHHVLPKSRYPEYRLHEWNLVIIDPEVHQKVEQDIEKCPKIKAYRDKLLALHQEGKL